MGGASLEVWKFGFYTLFPLATLYYFSDDDWYNTHVVPYGKKIWPEYEKTNKPPHTQEEIQAQLRLFKAQRQSKFSSNDPSVSTILNPSDLPAPDEVKPTGAVLSHGMRSAASSGIFGTDKLEPVTPVQTEQSKKEEGGWTRGWGSGTSSNGGRMV